MMSGKQEATNSYQHKLYREVNLKILDNNLRKFLLLSRSSLEPLISLDLVGTKLYCFRARVHCYHCLYIIFSTNPVRRSEELRGGPIFM